MEPSAEKSLGEYFNRIDTGGTCLVQFIPVSCAEAMC